MAHVQQANLNTFGHVAGAVANAAASAVKSVGRVFALITEAQYREAEKRAAQIRLLNKLTDVELAEKYGINRDGIAAYVFRDKMF